MGQTQVICIDPGHGAGNRKLGVFDPGAVRFRPGPPASGQAGSQVVEAREAEIALAYAVALDEILRAYGFKTVLTRQDNIQPCPLVSRLRCAREHKAALLLSLHLNADPDPEGPKDPQARGHEVLYRTAASAAIARAISRELAPLIPAHGPGICQRNNLLVLHYEPSVLVELGFIDSDDYGLLSDQIWKLKACQAIAEAILKPGPTNEAS